MVLSMAGIVCWQCETGCCAAKTSARVVGQVANGASRNGDDGWVSCTACKLGADGVGSVRGAGGGSSGLSGRGVAIGGT